MSTSPPQDPDVPGAGGPAQPPPGGGYQAPPPASGYDAPPPAAAYGGPPPAAPAAPVVEPEGYGAPTKGFFGSLFDFKFDNFVTPIIVRFVYILALIGLAFTWLSIIITGFARNFGFGLLGLIIGGIGILVYVCFVRMTLEFFVSVVRMSQDIHKRLPSA